MRTTSTEAHRSEVDRYPPPPPPTGRPADGNARTLAIVGFVCAGIGVLILPILFCPAAVILGLMAYRRGDPLGRWVIAAGVVSFVAAVAIAAAVLDGTDTAAALG